MYDCLHSWHSEAASFRWDPRSHRWRWRTSWKRLWLTFKICWKWSGMSVFHVIHFYVIPCSQSMLIQSNPEWTSTETFFFTFLSVSFINTPVYPVSTGAVLNISHPSCIIFEHSFELWNCQPVSPSITAKQHTHFYPARTISSSTVISWPQSPSSVHELKWSDPGRSVS